MARETDYTSPAEKACSRCELVKPADDFYFSKSTKIKLSSRCKQCMIEAARESVERRKDEVKEYKRNWEKERVASGKRRSQWHENRDHHLAAAKAWREGNPDKVIEINRRKLLKKYGLTPEAYAEMLHSQGGCCMICNQPPEEGKNLHVDHCHKTGIVRGLLCMKCNTILGKAKDDVEVLQSAIDYLKKWS